MSRDDIIHMAFEASGGVLSYDAEGRWILSEQEVIRLAALVAAAEREACAEICERLPETFRIVADEFDYKAETPTAENYAAAIRARGATECEGMRWEHTAVVWTAPQSERGEK